MSSISIVIPVYNSEKYLKRCIKSVLKQTYMQFELILVNDGSTDKSLEICNEYKKRDNRIKVINKQNEGSIKARKAGIESATSDYITFIDSDDWIHSKTLENIDKRIKEDNPEVLVYNMYKTLGKFKFIKKKFNTLYFDKKDIYEGRDIKDELVVAYLTGHPFSSGLCGKVYKKKILLDNGKYLKNIKFLGDDLYYNLEIFLKIKKVSMINKPLYYYRTGGYTSKFMPYLFDDSINGYRIQKKVINQYFKHDIERRYNGISIMLLNTFKTCLYNIFLSDLDNYEIQNKILEYTSNNELLEATKNYGAIRYFDKQYLEAINTSNYKYLMNMGKEIYDKSKIKRIMLKYLT